MLSMLLSTSLSLTTLPEFGACTLDKHRSEIAHSQCATVKLPLYHDRPSSQTIDIFIRKFPSLQKSSGSVWLLAGGPGESGAAFYRDISWYQSVFPGYDIYVKDHRGTGASAKLCLQEQINSELGIELAPNEWGPCYGYIYQNLDYVKGFTISQGARDVATLINHYGGNGNNYIYGASYGTQLAMRVLSHNEVKVNGVILDSMVPHQTDKEHNISNFSFITNKTGQLLLSRLSDNPKDIERKILAFKAKYPLLSDRDTSLPSVSLSQFLGSLLDLPSVRSQIPDIVNDLDKGGLDTLKKAIQSVESWKASLPPRYTNEGLSIILSQFVTKSENNLNLEKTKQQVLEEEKLLAFTSPVPHFLAENTLPTYSKDKWYADTPKVDTPILVLQGDLDPKTHLEGAKAHLSYLKGEHEPVLYVVKDAPHVIAASTYRVQAEKPLKQFIQSTQK